MLDGSTLKQNCNFWLVVLYSWWCKHHLLTNYNIKMYGYQQGKVNKKSNLPKIQLKNGIVFYMNTRKYIQNILK